MWCARRLVCPVTSQFKRLCVTSSSVPVENLKHVETAATIESPGEEPNVLNPLAVHDYFGVRRLVTVADLFYARAHYGHRDSVRNLYMTPYLFGNRQGIDIFDLNQTVELLGDALNFVAHVAYRSGVILLVSRNRQMQPLIERTAEECGEFAHCRYWTGNAFTDSERFYGVVTRLPDLVILLHTLNNVFLPHPIVVEAAKMLVPTVAVVDSNCDPRLISYPIPGNDDSPITTRMWTGLVKEAILRGKAEAIKDGAVRRPADPEQV